MTVFLLLLLAHLLGDFTLQPLSWIKDRRKNKERSSRLLLHILMHTMVAWLLLWNLELWWAAAVILITHWGIDVWKSYQKNTLSVYLTDQALHMAVIITLSILIVNSETEVGFLQLAIDDWQWHTPYPVLVIAPALLLMLRPTSLVVSYFMQNFDLDAPDQYALENAGKWIGYFERIIILMSILIGAHSVLGFLVAAKSLLRFNDKKGDRKHTEYVLVGSLLSWTIGIAVAVLAAQIV